MAMPGLTEHETEVLRPLAKLGLRDRVQVTVVHAPRHPSATC